MSLNIKNVQTYKLVVQLADLTGETLTAAVTQAVHERLERLRSPEHGTLFERLLAIADECAAHVDPALRSIDHGALLYDDVGLPK